MNDLDIYREVLRHQRDKLGVSVAEYADTCGVSRDKLREFCDGDDNALTVSERTRISTFSAELIDAEHQEIEDSKWSGQRPSKTVWESLRDRFGAQT